MGLRRIVLLVAATFLAACNQAPADDDAATDDSAEVKSLKGVTAEERNAYLRRAQILVDDDIESKDVLEGPKGKGKFALNEEVTCDFVEPTEKDELNGNSKKFQCRLPAKDGEEGDIVKVKYGDGPDDNGEIYGETIATRLMWTLGLAADRMYPVRVTCNGCPEDPWAAYKDFSPGKQAGGERKTRRYMSAVIEQKFDGAKIEQEGKEDQGWSWGELRDDGANERAGGAPLGHVNGFKLLAAFMKHADNKAENQRLVCPKDALTSDGKCQKPVLMIQDAGVTFGGAAHLFGLVYNAEARARYNDWIAHPVWKDRGSCQADLRDARTGTMTHPQIYEAGRAFLASRLARLSDKQITDLFVASRIEERGEEMDDIRVDAPSPRRKVTVDDWRIAFKVHRDEITKIACPR